MDFFSQLFNRPAVQQVEPDQVNELLKHSPRPFLLDVRTAGEYKQGHVHGAELIPLDELLAKQSRLPKEREIICICASGNRSSSAARKLSALGYQVKNMSGGMNRWTRANLPVKLGMAK